MTSERPSALLPDARLLQLLAAYVKAAEAGEAPDRAEWIARHPDLADRLAEFFADLDSFGRAAGRRSTGGPPANGTVDDRRLTGPHTPATEPRAQAAMPTGCDLPGYEILGELGRGGMGVVFKAEQVRLKRPVALKMLKSGDHAGPDDLARFRAEAEAVARLAHPNIVQIYEVGEYRGQPFLALEFVAGGSLSDHLAGKPQAPRPSAEWARELAEAMAAAHAKGIVHRDLKPANVLLSRRASGQLAPADEQAGRLLYDPKITDFGLAKRLDVDQGHTATGAILGTPMYMAPEQAMSQKAVGPLADVYGLGGILYEMLTGRPPFQGASLMETLEQVVGQDPVPVRLLQPKVPRDLETICLKCLSKEPGRRYVSAQALADDLGRFLEGRPVQARRSRPWERAYRWVRRNPVVAAMAGLVVAAFLAGFAGVAWQWQVARAGWDRAETSLYFQRVSLAGQALQADNADRAAVLLDSCPEPLRHWEWHYLRRRCTSWTLLEGHTDQVRGVTYAADGRRLASCGNDGTVRLWDAQTGSQVRKLRHEGWVRAVVFHRDGKRLLSVNDAGLVKFWAVNDGRELRREQFGLVASAAFSPDGRFLATQAHSKGLSLHNLDDLDTGRAFTTIQGEMAHKHAVAFSFDGRFVSSNLDSRLQIWETATGKLVHHLHNTPLPEVYALAFSPDGSRLFASLQENRDSVLRDWDVATGRESPAALGTPLTVQAIAVSADGRLIATGGQEGAVKVRDLTGGKDQRGSRQFGDTIASLAFGADGQALAVSAGREVWVRDSGRAKDLGLTSLKARHPGGATSVAFSPNGVRVASCGEDAQVKVCDARTGRVVAELTGPARRYSAVAFSPYGASLLATGHDGAVYTWKVGRQQLGPVFQVQASEAPHAAFSPDGRHVATASKDGRVQVWDAATGEQAAGEMRQAASVWGVCFSPDGRRLATAGSDGIVRLWAVAGGREEHSLRGHLTHVQSVAFQPGGRFLASASTDETVRLWDVDSGREVAHSPLKGHTGGVRGLSFSPDGLRLASASDDGTLRLWDVATGQEALSLAAPNNGKARGVAFSPDDGGRLAVATSDGTVWVWDAARSGGRH